MKKFTFNTFELLKYLIENEYLQGVEGHVHAFSEPPSPYGKNSTYEIEELSNEYLEPRGDFDFLCECDSVPDHIDTKFTIEDNKIKISARDTIEWGNSDDYDDYKDEDDEQDCYEENEEENEREDIVNENVYFYTEGCFDDKIFNIVVGDDRKITIEQV